VLSEWEKDTVIVLAVTVAMVNVPLKNDGVYPVVVSDIPAANAAAMGELPKFTVSTFAVIDAPVLCKPGLLQTLTVAALATNAPSLLLLITGCSSYFVAVCAKHNGADRSKIASKRNFRIGITPAPPSARSTFAVQAGT